LGGCDDDQRIKCLALMDGWNYIAWFYQPSPRIIDGSWVGPMVQTA
jgi:hypothetical protein